MNVNDIINYEKRRRGWIEKGQEYEIEIIQIIEGFNKIYHDFNDKPFIDIEEIKYVHSIIE